MARIYLDIPVHIQEALQALEKQLFVSAGKIGSAYSRSEQRIAAEQDFFFFVIQSNGTGAMAG